MTINEIQDEIIEEFEFFGDWMEKYEHIIDFGKGLSGIDAELKTDENLVKGCQSRVWLHAHTNADRLKFEADSDAVITKGLIGLLIKVLDNGDNQRPIILGLTKLLVTILMLVTITITKANTPKTFQKE